MEYSATARFLLLWLSSCFYLHEVVEHIGGFCLPVEMCKTVSSRLMESWITEKQTNKQKKECPVSERKSCPESKVESLWQYFCVAVPEIVHTASKNLTSSVSDFPEFGLTAELICLFSWLREEPLSFQLLNVSLKASQHIE